MSYVLMKHVSKGWTSISMFPSSDNEYSLFVRGVVDYLTGLIVI